MRRRYQSSGVLAHWIRYSRDSRAPKDQIHFQSCLMGKIPKTHQTHPPECSAHFLVWSLTSLTKSRWSEQSIWGVSDAKAKKLMARPLVFAPVK